MAVGLAVLAAIPWAAALAEPASPDRPKWGPHIDLEGRAGTKRNLGEADLFIPVLQDADTMLFSSIRSRIDDAGSSEGNFGLGVRQMLEAGWNLGAYAYYDRRRTDTGNYFSQATLGLEALSLDWDLRANAYLPVGARTHTLASVAGGQTSAALVGTTIQVTTSGGLLREERSLSGFDAEVGWRVPVFAADAAQQLRVYAGGYHFTGDNVPDVTGPRFRAEMVFDDVPGLWDGSRFSLGAEWQEDEPRGDQGFLTARLRIPLQVYGRPASQLTPMERRMADPVVRDIDVVSQTRSVEQPATVETATETSGGQVITVLDSGNAYGTDLSDEFTTAGANAIVILKGTFNTTATSAVQANQTVMGAGSLTVRTASGRTATLTTSAATIAGTIGGNSTLTLASSSTARGLTISNTVGGVSEARGVSISGNNATLANNTITANQTAGTGDAVALSVTAGTGISLSNNTVTATVNGGGGSIATVLSVSGGAGVTASSNTLSASGAAANRYANLQSANINAGSTGNTLAASNTGVCVTNAGGSGQIEFTNAAACTGN